MILHRWHADAMSIRGAWRARFGRSRVDPVYLAATEEDMIADLLDQQWLAYEQRKRDDPAFLLTARAAEDPAAAAERLKHAAAQADRMAEILRDRLTPKPTGKIQKIAVRQVKKPGGTPK